MIELKDNTKILYIGDSITSCGRSLYTELGFGFPNMVTAALSAKHPEKNIMGVSRGIGRNRTCDMLKRWNYDCIEVNPDIVIILIGINDAIEQFFTGVRAETPEQSEENLRKMVSTIKDRPVILMEPFLNFNSNKWTNPWQITEEWDRQLLPIRKAVKNISDEFGTYFIPLYDIFRDLAEKYGPDKWTAEGVHPTVAGHGIITEEILKLFR